jgi:hypothetical protein
MGQLGLTLCAPSALVGEPQALPAILQIRTLHTPRCCCSRFLVYWTLSAWGFHRSPAAGTCGEASGLPVLLGEPLKAPVAARGLRAGVAALLAAARSSWGRCRWFASDNV